MEQENGSESFTARRTESLDAQSISKLVRKATESIFGRINAEYIIEKANLAITLASATSSEVLGHMALFDYPSPPSVGPAAWEEWLHRNFNCPKASPLNALFLHLFVAKEGFHQGASTEILHTTFMAVPLLQYVFLTVSPGTNLGPALEAHFSPVPVLEGASPELQLFLTYRHQHFPQLYVRTARVEDADDLMPVFRQYTSDMNEEYGEHFLAELIESQDEDHKTIVAEVKGRAVGFISLTTEVDADLLNSCYQLGPFHGLRYPSETNDQLSAGEQSSQPSSVSLLSETRKSVAASEASAHRSSTSTPVGEPKSPTASVSELKHQPGQTSTQSIRAVSRQPSVTESQSKGTTSPAKATLSQAKITASRAKITDSQAKLTTSKANITDSHAKLTTSKAKITDSHAKLTTSKAKITDSHAKLTTSKVKITDSQAKLTTSKAKITDSHAKLTTSKAKITDSHTKLTTSKAKITDSQAKLTTSKAKITDSQAKLTSNLTHSQSKLTKSGLLKSSASLASQLAEPTDEEATPQPDEGETPVPDAASARRKRLEGQCSAVAIQLFAIDEKYEMRSLDLLPAVFQQFPDHDFCVLTQPHNTPEFPLLSHFMRVNPRVGTRLSQELYVFHKCALLHSFSVRRAEQADLAGVERLVAELKGGEEVVEGVRRFVEGRRDPIGEGATPLFAAVAVCSDQIVGVAVLRQEEDLGYIRSHYNLEDFVYFAYHRPEEHAHLHHLMLNPTFASHTKHFLKELLRLSHKSCLYYPVHDPASLQRLKPHTVTSALGDLVPVSFRRQVVYPRSSLGINAPLAEVGGARQPFALYHTNRKLTLEPKIAVNSRVLVVGASDTAIAFLEKLVYSPHLRFNNLTLVSPHGLPHYHKERRLPHGCCYWPETHPLLGLRTWVNVVKGKVVSIDRPEQQVVVEGGAGSQQVVEGGAGAQQQEVEGGAGAQQEEVEGGAGAQQQEVEGRADAQQQEVEGGAGPEALLSYDYLVLCVGTQFRPPAGMGLPVPRSNEQGRPGLPTVFSPSDEKGVDTLLAWVKKTLLPDVSGELVVYGSSLAAYSVIAAVLGAGLPSSRLVLVQPRAHSCFNNPALEERVGGALQEEGVALQVGFMLQGLSSGEKGVGFGRALFLGADGEQQLNIECKGLVCLEEKQVDSQAFKAMNDACLVFDRRLVIDTEHRTNDPLIFAAGPITKFSRRYRADKWTHANFNSKEVGQKLAGTVLALLDPTAEGSPPASEDPDLLPTYSQPKATAATLPGGLHYLHVEKPNLGESLQTLVENPHFGRELVTDTDSGYFRLHVNQYGRIQTITVLSRQDFEVTNYLCLYDTNEKYLNNMVSRYDEKLIPDFFNYFREPWACAVFHDRFPDFVDEVREHLAAPLEGGGESFEETVRKLVEDEPIPSLAKHRARLAADFSTSSAKATIQKRLFRFLHYNSYHLPMYARPDMI